MPSILFIAAHRLNRSPSQRFRFEQYLPFLRQNGFECQLSPLLDEKNDRSFYSHGNFFEKARIVANSYFRRKKDITEAKDSDIIFIQREAFMTGTTHFERALKRSGKKIVFDFDDAIWLPNVSEGNQAYQWLKDPSKTSGIIALSDLVIAGNNYLAEYALQFNKNVVVIPTTIDTEYHHKKQIGKKSGMICIGWTGSHTTIPHFEQAIPFLKKLKERFAEKIYFKVIGDSTYKNPELDINGIAWNLENEIAELSEFDIGIMPLPETEWAKGKCGLKGLQYMSLEIPSVMSPVGVNLEIVSDGVNGFLAGSEEVWMDKISRLIENAELRKTIGAAARKTVEEKYSVRSQEGRYLEALNQLLS